MSLSLNFFSSLKDSLHSLGLRKLEDNGNIHAMKDCLEIQGNNYGHHGDRIKTRHE